ncbi:MAG: radical SAM protein, partial [Muribaculaceae bacterium]|nr:radical SAM protein [Muribaculaceae bacterium]
VLFNSTIFGPIHSRRLGSSLGVNLSPSDGKICSFDCLYCEAGYNAQGPGTSGLPARTEVARMLDEKLAAMRAAGQGLDVITFSGNGEPTIHPDFAGIIDDTIALRDKYFPQVKISVLTNSTMLGRPQVVEALRKVDNNILKLDSAIERTVQLLDRPSLSYRLPKVIEQLAQFSGSGIIQTMITRGSHDGEAVDNSTDEEIAALIEAYRHINPRSIMIYSIDRRTPEQSLQKVEKAELRAIAARITEATGIEVSVA